MRLWHQALILARRQNDPRSEAQALNSIGYEYKNSGYLADALTAFRQELTASRNMADKAVEAETQNGIGWTAYAYGLYDEARAAFQQSRVLFHAVANPDKEVGALFGLGLLDTDAGRLSEAMAAHQKSSVIAVENHAPNSQANALSGIGNVYIYMGRPADARDSFERAMPLFLATRDTGGEAWMRFGMGRAAIEEDQTDKAIESLQRAQVLFRGMNAWSPLAQTLNYIGIVHANAGHLSASLTNLEQARQVCPADDKYDAAPIFFSFGVVYARMGHRDEALSAYRKALQIWHAAGDRTHEAILRGAMADVERQQGQRVAAQADYAQSIDLAEQIRTSLGYYDSTKQAYLTSMRYIYDGYLDSLLTPLTTRNASLLPAHAAASRKASHSFPASDLSGAESATAFRLTQQMKGRSLLDFLESGQVDLDAVLTESERAQLRELRQRSDTLNTLLVKEGVENYPGAKLRYAARQEEQRRVEAQLRTLTDALDAHHPELAARRAAKIAMAGDLAPLLDADTALLEYVQTAPDHLAVFVVTRGGGAQGTASDCQVVAHYLDASQTLATDCAAFHAACANPHGDYQALAARLGKTLIAPLASALKKKKRLIVCPDGPLWNVPFQALTTQTSHGGAAFLADRFEIDYAYSATGALAAHNERAKQKAAVPGGAYAATPDSMLVVANPAFGDAGRFGNVDNLPGQRPIDKPSRPLDKPSRPIDKPSRAMTALLARGGRIAPLPGTLREAHALQRQFPQATLLTGDQAQERTVKQDLAKNRYRFVHFATHGFINDAAPMLSSLVLAQPDARDAKENAAANDGFLTARELFDLRLSQTEMVTLSACNTGRGSIQSGEGVVGMTWALFAAGCPTQVVSQWSVDDACTASLMAKFYASLKVGKPKGEALHEAAMATASDSSNAAHRHPYYWAPFVLFGEWK